LTAQETQIRNGRCVNKITQITQHYTRSIDVARFQLLHRLHHRQWDSILICSFEMQNYVGRKKDKLNLMLSGISKTKFMSHMQRGEGNCGFPTPN